MSTDGRPAGARVLLPLLLLSACGQAPAPHAEREFPALERAVAPIVSSRFSTEDARDSVHEADMVMNQVGTRAGMSVADIGAGEGYYTLRLAARVGPKGRVLAQDVVPEVRDRLAERVTREALDNVSVKLGEPNDPKLPADSFDQIFLVHMYHEIAAPYEFLWRLRPALRPNGRVVVVDADRNTARHGTPPALLDCEMRSVGYVLERREKLPAIDAYLALYRTQGERPEPGAIKPCRS